MIGKRVERCLKCGNPFVVFGGHSGPRIDRDEIVCPYCAALWGTERIADVFHTRRMSPAEQVDYLRSKK